MSLKAKNTGQNENIFCENTLKNHERQFHYPKITTLNYFFTKLPEHVT